MKKEPEKACALCGKSKSQVKKLVVGLHGAVCNYCIDLCHDMMQVEGMSGTSNGTGKGIKQEVCEANRMLPQLGLVVMHSGNVSGYDRDTDTLYIKPSGVDYDKLTPDQMVPVKVKEGKVQSETMKPSVDLPHHLYLYRKMPDVRGIVHTHSNFATAFAAVGKPIPVVLTAIADEFGGEIPCTPYVDNEGDSIGKAILRHKKNAPAVLLGNHGVFAWGDSPAAALKAAAMVEDVAKTVWLAHQFGRKKPAALPPEEVDKWYDRYQNRYGQKGKE